MRLGEVKKMEFFERKVCRDIKEVVAFIVLDFIRYCCQRQEKVIGVDVVLLNRGYFTKFLERCEVCENGRIKEKKGLLSEFEIAYVVLDNLKGLRFENEEIRVYTTVGEILCSCKDWEKTKTFRNDGCVGFLNGKIEDFIKDNPFKITEYKHKNGKGVVDSESLILAERK